jgi:hypothetical protein
VGSYHSSKRTAPCCHLSASRPASHHPRRHAGTASGSCATGGRTGRRTSRSARSRAGRATCTTSPSRGSAARCGGTRTSPGCACTSTARSSSSPSAARATRSRAPTRRCPSSSVQRLPAARARRLPSIDRLMEFRAYCVDSLFAGEWFNADTEAVINQALQTGAGPNVSDAYTFNGLPGPTYNCSSKGTLSLQGLDYLGPSLVLFI